MSDQFKVTLAAAGSFGLSLSEANTLVQIAVGVSALGYTLWKWRQAALRKRKEK